MKKVGICACYGNYNFGSMLQSFALQTQIEKLGFENEYIVYSKEKSIRFKIKSIPRLLDFKFLINKIDRFKRQMEINNNPKVKKNIQIRKEAFKKFAKKYYKNFSEEFIEYKELKEGAKKYSAVVVGSDQLWLPVGLKSNFYNLMFVPNEVNKISYATSFGVSQIPCFQRKKTKEYLSRINYLSTREIRGKEIIEEVAGLDAKVVVDPTLLFNEKEWLEYIPNKRIINEKYIFCYFLGNNIDYRKEVKKLADKTGNKIITIPHLEGFFGYDEHFGDIHLYDVGPEEFVNLIRNAEYICTDSFHGTVFSLINHKKFITFNRFLEGNKNSRNSRIDSLCTQLSIKNRRFEGNIMQIVKDIEYDKVDKKIDELRKYSQRFLKEALEDKNGFN